MSTPDRAGTVTHFAARAEDQDVLGSLLRARDAEATQPTAATLVRGPVHLALARYISCLQDLLESIDFDQVERVVETLRHARETGASVYVIGNGGSAATAAHFVTDLINMNRRSGKRPLKVMSLVDNTAMLTAHANDLGYENVFRYPLETFAAPGDVLIAISASGNSPNVTAAVELARERALTTVGIVGFDGGALLRLVDAPIHVRSLPGLYGPVEDVHAALQHMISSCLEWG